MYAASSTASEHSWLDIKFLYPLDSHVPEVISMKLDVELLVEGKSLQLGGEIVLPFTSSTGAYDKPLSQFISLTVPPL